MNVATPGALAVAPPPPATPAAAPRGPIAPPRGTPVASPQPNPLPVAPITPSAPFANQYATPVPIAGPAPLPPGPALPGRDASMSMPIAARRPWGLIVVVLLIDIGLAVAGSILLRQGLATASTGSATPPAARGAPGAGTTTSK